MEPDEVDGYANDSGFPFTYEDQIADSRFIAELAHGMGMSVGLKGACRRREGSMSKRLSPGAVVAGGGARGALLRAPARRSWGR
ncbi:endo alpha-1,4 polygalactosaminidase [Sorangium sp. So ce590]|uniref:endo alpha-1,4 polygalactosaminidase n=1 Tax=unclassified Sorangium TaxID=2621164 RepID=UPI003F613865